MTLTGIANDESRKSAPILASRIDGNVGILGANYPGYFELGDTAHLARLLRRAETSPDYLAELKTWSKRLAPLVDPTREEQAWSDFNRGVETEVNKLNKTESR